MKTLLTILSILFLTTSAYAETYTVERVIEGDVHDHDAAYDWHNTGGLEDREGTYTIERVVDGDTLKLTNGERVHLIGIDTPKILPEGVDLTLYDPPERMLKSAERLGVDLITMSKMGKEATEFVKSLLSW